MIRNRSCISLFFLLFVSLINAQNFRYKGNNQLNNFVLEYVNSSDSIVTISLQQGQVIEPNSDWYPDFVLAKSYTFVLAPQSNLKDQVIAYSIENKVLPDSAMEFTLTDRKHESIAVKLKVLEENKTWGNKAQIQVWNLMNDIKLNDDIKYIYTFNKKHVFESNKERSIHVLALIDTVVVDTLISKSVKEGMYSLTLNKNILSNIKGKSEYQIVSDAGEILFQSGLKILVKDTLSCFYTFNYNSSKAYSKTTLKVYAMDGKLVSILFSDKKLVHGSNKQTYMFDFYGDENEKFLMKLTTSKGESIEEKEVSYKFTLAQSVGKNTGERYFIVKEKFSSKKSELRTKCTIEDVNGEVLATVFEGKNIHSGINKIDYTFKNQLNDGDEVYLYVRTPAGKVITRNVLTVYNK